MGNQISDLYNQVINEHRKYPRNKGLVRGYKTLHLKNPSCADAVTVQVEIKVGKIVDVNDDFCYGIIYDKLLSNKIENKKIECSFETRSN